MKGVQIRDLHHPLKLRDYKHSSSDFSTDYADAIPGDRVYRRKC